MLLTDLRNAWRSLRLRPAFAAAAILTIALGVGANTAIYSVIRAVLLDPLPFRDPDRLVQLWETHPELPSLQVAYQDFVDWRQSVQSFDGLAAYTEQAMNRVTLLGQGEPVQLQATMASHDLIPMLGIQPLIGRGFTAREEEHQDRVVLLSEAVWRGRFSADTGVIGRAIRIENLSFTVVGVVPTRQAFPVWAEIWLPLSFLEPQLQTTRRFHPLEVVGRLKPGVPLEKAQVEVASIAGRLARTYPETNRTEGACLLPLAGQISGEVRPALLIVWCAVGLVLLIATANVAHLMMARAIDRRREVAIRVSLGASATQLIRQFLSESLLLALGGGALGFAVAFWAMPLLRSLAQDRIPRFEGVGFDASVWLFTFAVSCASGVLFGLPACGQVLHTDLNQVIKGGVESPLSPGRFRPGRILMASEFALAFVVLFGAALLVRSFRTLLKEDPGFRPRGVIAINVPLPSNRYTWDKASQFFETQLAPRLRAIPGVESVAAANSAPLSLGTTEHSRFATRFGVAGRTFEPGRFPVAQIRWVSEDYFKVLGIPLKRGRLLSERDYNQPRYLINETLARRFYPNQDPVGKQLILDVVNPQPNSVEIVGVVGDVRELGLDVEAQPTMYLLSVSPGPTVLVRTSLDQASVAPVIRRILANIDPEVPITRAQTLSKNLGRSLARRRFALWLITVFAGLAAFLTAIGIYGVVSYSVGQRFREFGIRTAVGARPSDLLAMVLRESLASVVPGLLLGALLAFAFSSLIKALLYKVSPTDALSMASVALFLLAVSLASALFPARRAAAVDPGLALREQ